MDEPTRLTPLPQEGRDRDAVSAPSAAAWRARLARKHLTARLFEALAAQMKRAGFDAADVDACAQIADEERVHAIMCGAVLESCGADAHPASSRAVVLPPHADVDAREEVLRNVLSIAYVGKSISVALFGAERAKLSPGPVREIVARIHTDEAAQARFAWGIVSREVPRLDAAAKARLGVFLAEAFAEAERQELAHLGASAQSRGGEGAARALFYETAFHVLVPALEELGLPARAAWEGRDGRRVA